MSFLVNFWLGLGNPRHIATKSQHLWAVPRQIEFWLILKKSWDWVRPPPLLGPNSQLLPKICFEGFPKVKIHKYKYYSKVGDRIPGIWFHKTKGVLVSTGLDGKASFNKFVKPLPSVGAWTRIEVKQSLVSSQHIFSITIGNEEVFTKPNTKPMELSDVKVFAGNPWSSSQKGSLRNLKIEIKETSIDCVPAGGIFLNE